MSEQVTVPAFEPDIRCRVCWGGGKAYNGVDHSAQPCGACEETGVDQDLRVCGSCEYFDGGGTVAIRNSTKEQKTHHGDCLNRSSPRFQTYSVWTCDKYVRGS